MSGANPYLAMYVRDVEEASRRGVLPLMPADMLAYRHADAYRKATFRTLHAFDGVDNDQTIKMAPALVLVMALTMKMTIMSLTT